jgi:cyclopropane fatty-acyl-phospholipid synthase-like methyltransferase
MANKNVIRQALKLAGLKKGEIFYDLGSGNGDVLIEAAKMGAKATGFEISPYYYILAKMKILIWSRLYHKNRSSEKCGMEIKVRFENIVNVDLSKPDAVYSYLFPKFLEKLAPKFHRELKSGSRLISVGFPIKALKNGTEHHINSRKIFIYKF